MCLNRPNVGWVFAMEEDGDLRDQRFGLNRSAIPRINDKIMRSLITKGRESQITSTSTEEQPSTRKEEEQYNEGSAEHPKNRLTANTACKRFA